jgi:hypothetical protein
LKESPKVKNEHFISFYLYFVLLKNSVKKPNIILNSQNTFQLRLQKFIKYLGLLTFLIENSNSTSLSAIQGTTVEVLTDRQTEKVRNHPQRKSAKKTLLGSTK